jgi:hypothetical protein
MDVEGEIYPTWLTLFVIENHMLNGVPVDRTVPP